MRALDTEAYARSSPIRELATTLLLLVATHEFVTAAQVGDGATVVAAEDGTLSLLTRPQIGEFINETTFLVSPRALETAEVAFWSGRAAHIAAFTDGLQMLALKLPEGVPHEPFFSPLFRFLAEEDNQESAMSQLAAFLGSPRVQARSDDDLTLLLAAPTMCATDVPDRNPS